MMLLEKSNASLLEPIDFDCIKLHEKDICDIVKSAGKFQPYIGIAKHNEKITAIVLIENVGDNKYHVLTITNGRQVDIKPAESLGMAYNMVSNSLNRYSVNDLDVRYLCDT